MKFINLITSTIIFNTFSLTVQGLDCPLQSDECTDGKGNFKPYTPETPACWRRTFYGWLCKPKEIGKECDTADLWVDASKCEIPPNPPCPSKENFCIYEGKKYFPTDSDAPACWAKNGDNWECQGSIRGGSCGSNKHANLKRFCSYDISSPTCISNETTTSYATTSTTIY